MTKNCEYRGEPIIREVCWLHLSDLHFRSNMGPFHTGLIVDIIGQLKCRGFTRLDAIFITGDVVWEGKSWQYNNAASKFLQTLLAKVEEVGVSFEKKGLFIIPGNHDFNRDRTSPPFEAFAAFGKREKIKFPCPRSVGKRCAGKYWQLKTREGVKLSIIGLNSAQKSDGKKKDKGRLTVSLKPFQNLVPGDPESDEIRILLLHHPMCFLEYKNEKDLRSNVNEYKIAYILRGHTHESNWGFKAGPTGKFVELVAGAAFTKKRIGTGYILFRMDIDGERCQTYFRRYEKGQTWNKDTRVRFFSGNKIEYGYLEWTYLDPTEPRNLFKSEFAGETRICSPTKRPKGAILYRGIPVEHILEEEKTYPEIIHLLSTGSLPENEKQLLTVLDELEKGYKLPDLVSANLQRGKSWLRFVSYIPLMFDPEEEKFLIDAFKDFSLFETAGLVCGRFAALVGKLFGEGQLQKYSKLPSKYKHAQFLAQFAEVQLDDWAIKLLDRVLVLFADHGCAPSTYAARVAASAGSHPTMCLSAAAATFGGFKHGGAAIKVIEILKGIPEPASCEEHLLHRKAQGKVPGFGHGLKFETKQTVLAEKLAMEVAERRAGSKPLCEIAIACGRKARQIRAKDRPDFPLPNVLLYLAPIIIDLRFKEDMLLPILASSRIIGWFLHAGEASREVIRPRLRYVGSRYIVKPRTSKVSH